VQFRAPSPRRNLISLTPLIDVVFILLVFFMLASSFLDWRAIDLKTPAEARTASQDKTPVVIAISSGGELSLNGAPVSRDGLTAAVQRALQGGSTKSVLVRPEPGVPVQTAVTVLDQVSRAGAPNVSLVRGAPRQ